MNTTSSRNLNGIALLDADESLASIGERRYSKKEACGGKESMSRITARICSTDVLANTHRRDTHRHDAHRIGQVTRSASRSNHSAVHQNMTIRNLPDLQMPKTGAA